MKEAFLHYVWKTHQFNQEKLTSTKGEPLQVLKPGNYNSDSGPDFFNARIRVAETVWAGNIEIHLKSSDWIRHFHNLDLAYENIILHVVYEDDKPDMGPENVPVLELKERIPHHVMENYLRLERSDAPIPCGKSLKDVSSLAVHCAIDKLAIERLETKSLEILKILDLNKNNWKETLYCFLAKSFGMKVNALPFELLAKSVSHNILLKHRNLKQIEALLFGQGGFLHSELRDDYGKELYAEYIFLSKKLDLTPLSSHIWKLMRLRPNNFPTIRIAQLAQLIYKKPDIISFFLDADLSEVIEVLNQSVSSYWENHYIFDKSSVLIKKKLGLKASESILINTVIPFMWVYGEKNVLSHYQSKAIRLLETLSPENNSVIADWNKFGIKPVNAFESQALLQLKNNYCIQKKCLNCTIGNEILRSNHVS